jgi:putative tryptophan/tyrosine transport system substrate-binding protein
VVDRRAFLGTLASGLLATPLAISAEPSKVARVGILLYGTPQADPNLADLRLSLRDLGHLEGRNLLLEYRFAEGKPERLPELATELVRLKPDLIVALGGDVTPAAQQATQTIPIVIWASNDPVQSELVTSLARPASNLTGITLILDALAGKLLALLKEAAPRVAKVAILWNPEHADPEFRENQLAARALGIQLQSLEARRPEDFAAAFQTASRDRSDAIMVVSSRLMLLQSQGILDFAERNRAPLVGGWGPWCQRGALLSYGPNLLQMAQRMATYVDRILKGAKPGDLPIQQPTTFELVINLKTAKALGLTIPQSLLLRADQVIE